jgi:HEAT repeat protein
MDNVSTLIADLQSDDPTTRAAAAEALGRQRCVDAVDALILLLADAEPTVRQAALNALRRIRDERASLHILAMLNDEDTGIRRGASSWCMTLSGDQAHLVETLVAMMLAENSRMSTREFAAMLLGKYGDERAVEPLHQLIQQYPRLRLRAAQSLQHMADPRSIPLMRELLADEDLRVGRTAAKTLRIIGTPAALEALETGNSKASDEESS